MLEDVKTLQFDIWVSTKIIFGEKNSAGAVEQVVEI